MKFGSYLKKAREAKRLSQHEVAERLSVSQKTLSNIESDKSHPTILQLAVMSEMYELNIIEMLSDNGVIFQEYQKSKKISSYDHHHFREIKELFEQLLKEKDARIDYLEAQIKNLKDSKDSKYI